MTPDPDSTLDRDRRALELLERCLGLEQAELDAALAEVEPELARSVRDLLGASGLEDVLATPPANPLEGLAREVVLPQGARLGAYEVLGSLGEGGIGRVYRARQDAPRREVALKTLRSNLASPESVARFRVEAELLARLDHPNIARVLEAGIAQVPLGDGELDVPFFALEYVRGGRTITEWVRAHQPSRVELLGAFRRLLGALQHAHQRGVIHRDLKPVNVLVDESGEPKVIDFGIARAEELEFADRVATRLGQILGTPATMAPEQLLAAGGDLDVRVDVFALGAILYELLCGRPLRDLSGISTQAAMREALLLDPPRPRKWVKDLPADLEAIVLKAIAPDREDRYPSAEAFDDDLRRYLNFETVRARRPRFGHQVALFVRRNRLISATLAAAVLGLLGTSLWAQVNAARARDAERAQVETTERAELLRIQAVDGALDFLSEFVNKLAVLPGSVEERAELLGRVAEELEALERDQDLDAYRRWRVGMAVLDLAALLGMPGGTNLGRPEEALAAIQRVEALAGRLDLEDPLGATVLRVRGSRNLASYAMYDQDLDKARAQMVLAGRRFEPWLAPEGPGGFDETLLEQPLGRALHNEYLGYLQVLLQLEMQTGNADAAGEIMARSIELGELDLERYPDDLYKALNVAMLKSNYAVLLADQDRVDEAFGFIEETIETYVDAMESGRIERGKMLPRLAEKQLLRAELAGELGRFDDQESSARELLEWTGPAREQDSSDMHNLTMHFTGLELLGMSHVGRGQAELDAGRPGAASEQLAAGIDLLEQALAFEDVVRETGNLWQPDEASRVGERLRRARDFAASLAEPVQD